MTSKQQKVQDINKAIRRSSTAKGKKAKAALLKDGRIEYSIESITRGGRRYRTKATFRDILQLLHGEDLRQLHKKYGR